MVNSRPGRLIASGSRRIFGMTFAVGESMIFCRRFPLKPLPHA
uniref:Uncharacterized protein n=1 Tax=uncultured Flavobacteriia bacterium TaxID=212695 RepID=H6RHC6_9BACT|nr:hypothetical protein VIS_S18DCB90001 [uncultured Flavobacteriia bacterium]